MNEVHNIIMRHVVAALLLTLAACGDPSVDSPQTTDRLADAAMAEADRLDALADEIDRNTAGTPVQSNDEFLAGLTQRGLAARRQFGGYDCTEDCSGHEAGYAWAEENSITDASECGGNSNSFIEGCEAWAEEQPTALELEEEW